MSTTGTEIVTNPNKSEAQALNKIGIDLLNKKQYDQALKHFLEALLKDDTIASAYSNAGSIYMLRGDYDKAIEFFNLGIKHDPDNANIYYNLASLYQHLNNYKLALDNIHKVIALEPNNMAAYGEFNKLLKMSVPEWHFRMMNDNVRNDAYYNAIKNTVKKGDIVLDIGTGSGLLAMMSAKAGAKHVYACEVNSVIADTARKIIKQNNLEDKITVLNNNSRHVELGTDIPERADVLTSEIIGSSFLAEGVLSTVEDAKSRLLKEDARIIPKRGVLYGCLIESKDLRSQAHVDKICGFDLSLFNDLRYFNEHETIINSFKHKKISEPFEIFTFDLEDASIKNNIKMLDIKIKEAGTCHVIGSWFKLYVDDDNVIDTYSGGALTNWKQTIRPLDKVRKFTKGEKVTLKADHNAVGLFISIDD